MDKNQTCETVYLYTLRNKKLDVRECPVTSYGSGKEYLTYVTYKDFYGRRSNERVVYPWNFGVIVKGPKLWLKNRDDELAKKLFKEHLEQRIVELQKKIDSNTEIIKLLNE